VNGDILMVVALFALTRLVDGPYYVVIDAKRYERISA